MKHSSTGKIKVLIVASSLRHVGGQSIQARRLVEAFADDDRIEIGFLPIDPETMFQDIKYLRTMFTSIKFWWLLLTRIGQFDIVQAFSGGSTSYIISTLPPLLFAKLLGRKVILNYHSGELESHIAEWPRTSLPTMKKFDEIVVPSAYLADVFRRHGLTARVAHNFVDTKQFVFQERTHFHPVFLSNRNFENFYQVSDVLRAFQIIQERVPEAALLIAGSGSEENNLKSLATELKLRAVEFLGKLTNDEMAKVYERADIYLNTSVVDNMPLSFIEAFACGLPIVSYATGGIPYLVETGETGLLVPVGDFRELAAKAVFLLENQEFTKKLIAKSRAEVVKYERENVRREWLELYAELAR